MNAVVQRIPRAALLALEAALKSRPELLGPQDFVTRHHFAPGSYAREIELPADSLVVGKIHRHAHVNVLSKGRCLVATEEGIVELVAPLTFVSKPGTKRVVLALEDTVWTTVHVTEETDLERIEAAIIAPDYAALDREDCNALGTTT